MLVFAKLLLVDEGAQVPAREPHLEAVVAHVVEGGGGEDLPEAAALELLRHDGGEEVQHRVGLSLVLEDGLGVRVESEDEARGVLAVPHGLELLVRHQWRVGS